MERKRLRKLRETCIGLQSMVRGKICAEKVILPQMRAALIIQKMYAGHRDRARLINEIKSVVIIQMYVRKFLQRLAANRRYRKNFGQVRRRTPKLRY